MAFGGSFKEDHPYATGILLVVIAGFGVAGSVTGQLAAMLAALWVPSALIINTSYGGSSSGGGSTLQNPTGGNQPGVSGPIGSHPTSTGVTNPSAQTLAQGGTV